jgi:hypothetical protein
MGGDGSSGGKHLERDFAKRLNDFMQMLRFNDSVDLQVRHPMVFPYEKH